MKLIIDIPEEVYKGLVDDTHIFVKSIFDAIKNGIPLDKIRDEIEESIESYVCDKEKNTMKAQGMLNAMQMMFEIIDKYTADKE